MKQSYFKSHDHHRLYYQVWQGDSKKAALLFVHGLNEHSGRYENPVRYFHPKGYTIYLFDQRGHGKSDGHRSYVDNFDQYLKDLHEFVGLVETNGPLFLIGHSLGGQIVINYVAKYRPKIQGMITSSANIETTLPISWLKRKAAFLLAPIFPKMSLANEIDPKWISRDPQVVKAYKKDPLVSKRISLNLATQILKNQEGLLNLAAKIKCPSLILHGGSDSICSPEGSKKFFTAIKSEDKKLLIYDDCYHELFNEYDQEKVFEDMESWIKGHSLSGDSKNGEPR